MTVQLGRKYRCVLLALAICANLPVSSFCQTLSRTSSSGENTDVSIRT